VTILLSAMTHLRHFRPQSVCYITLGNGRFLSDQKVEATIA